MSFDVMYELLMADNPADDTTFQSDSWTLLELYDLYEITPWDYATATKSNFNGVTSTRFDAIKLLLAVEIANRAASIVRGAEKDPDADLFREDDYDWLYGADSDPSDNDNYMRDI